MWVSLLVVGAARVGVVYDFLGCGVVAGGVGPRARVVVCNVNWNVKPKTNTGMGVELFMFG